jgi:hypothetical protein
MPAQRALATRSRIAVTALAAGVVVVVSSACGATGGAPTPVAPCPLLTPTEVSAAAGSTFGPGSPSVSDTGGLICTYKSSKGSASLFSWRGAGPGVRVAPNCSGKLEQADGKGYRGFVCTTNSGIQTMYVAKGNNNLELEIDAAATTGAARSLGALAATRLH